MMKEQGGSYLDNAATMAKYGDAIEAEADFYREINANPLRGLYKKSVQATTGVEAARKAMLELVGAGKLYTVIFCRGTTEALNLVANGLKKGDDGFGVVKEDAKVVVDIESHHSNILPWKTRYKNFILSTNLEKDTKDADVISLTGVSNVTGEDFSERIKNIRMSHPKAILGIDGAQMVGHKKMSLGALGADYIAFSGHKFGAPMGIGGLVIKKELARKLRPLNYGGEMVEAVSIDGTPTYSDIPERLEAGTLPVGAIFGLEKAARIAYKHFEMYREYCIVHLSMGECIDSVFKPTLTAMKGIPGVRILAANGSIITFQVDGVHPHDVAQILAAEGVAVRAGYLCAQPYLEYKGWGPVVRVSFSEFNSCETGEDEPDTSLIKALLKVREKMGLKDVRRRAN